MVILREFHNKKSRNSRMRSFLNIMIYLYYLDKQGQALSKTGHNRLYYSAKTREVYYDKNLENSNEYHL